MVVAAAAVCVLQCAASSTAPSLQHFILCCAMMFWCRVQHLQNHNSRSRGPSPPNAKQILRPDIPLAPDPLAPPAAAAARAATRPAATAAAQRQQRQQPQQQQQQRRQHGAAATAAAALQQGAAAAGAVVARVAVSKEEERLRQIIMADILEKAPSVTFTDIAGLKLAKQSLQEAVILPT